MSGSRRNPSRTDLVSHRGERVASRAQPSDDHENLKQMPDHIQAPWAYDRFLALALPPFLPAAFF
jgi:hypothetical protein